MRVEKVPVEFFIPTIFQHNSQISTMIQPWRVEPTELQEIVIRALREMGIYTVDQRTAKAVTSAAMQQLRFSPEIRTLLEKAQRLENSRNNRNRVEE